MCNDQAYSYLRVKVVAGFSPFVLSAYTQRGGHTSSIESFAKDAMSYADRNVLAFFDAVATMNTAGELESLRKEVSDRFPWFND